MYSNVRSCGISMLLFILVRMEKPKKLSMESKEFSTKAVRSVYNGLLVPSINSPSNTSPRLVYSKIFSICLFRHRSLTLLHQISRPRIIKYNNLIFHSLTLIVPHLLWPTPISLTQSRQQLLRLRYSNVRVPLKHK